MHQISVEREVGAPADAVWTVLTDVPRWEQTLSAVSSVERLDEGTGFGVGTRWCETRTMMGRSETQEMVVTEVIPGRSYVVEAHAHGAHYRSVLAVEPLRGDRSRLVMTFGGEPSGRLARVLAATVGRLAAGMTRRALAVDLADLARAAESPGA